MLKDEFAAEISHAAAGLYALYFPGETVPKSRLMLKKKFNRLPAAL